MLAFHVPVLIVLSGLGDTSGTHMHIHTHTHTHTHTGPMAHAHNDEACAHDRTDALRGSQYDTGPSVAS